MTRDTAYFLGKRFLTGLIAALLALAILVCGVQFIVPEVFWEAWGGTILIVIPAVSFIVA